MKTYWIAFVLVLVLGFLVLGWAGWRIYQEKPPIPESVVTKEGKVLIAPGDIGEGQNVWQAMGGMELGSVWGHGSYVAPDWTADWLHRECEWILNRWSQTEYGKWYAQLLPEHRAALQARLTGMMRKNTYQPATGSIVIDSIRAAAFEANALHYAEVFSKGKSEYAIPSGALQDPVKLRQLSAFFFWTSWAASTNRPGDEISYTSNWPHEDLVDNHPTPDALVWTGVSIILLLAGIGAMVWYHASQAPESLPHMIPNADPLFNTVHTPSQKATIKYFFAVSALILVQI
ncbi:MAG: nitric-oxide reductase large subunit, partial [Ignavibacteriae bacterium]